jgi:hypothetical protein
MKRRGRGKALDPTDFEAEQNSLLHPGVHHPARVLLVRGPNGAFIEPVDEQFKGRPRLGGRGLVFAFYLRDKIVHCQWAVGNGN